MDKTKLPTPSNFTTLVKEIKTRYAKESDFQALKSKVEGLVETGGEANVIDKIKVNGEALQIEGKEVDLAITTGKTNGNINVNGTDVPVFGLKGLAYKEDVTRDDLGEDLSAILDGKADGGDLEQLGERVSANETAIETLNGDGDGSVKKQVADAVAGIVADAPQAYDTLVEIADWITNHTESASQMSKDINDNKTAIANIKDGKSIDSFGDVEAALGDKLDKTDDLFVSSIEGEGKPTASSEPGTIKVYSKALGGGVDQTLYIHVTGLKSAAYEEATAFVKPEALNSTLEGYVKATDIEFLTDEEIIAMFDD